MGRKGPRALDVVLPGLDHEGEIKKVINTKKGIDQLRNNQDHETTDFIKLKNKQPTWNESTLIRA